LRRAWDANEKKKERIRGKRWVAGEGGQDGRKQGRTKAKKARQVLEKMTAGWMTDGNHSGMFGVTQLRDEDKTWEIVQKTWE
jgi:hypothetical protein